MTAKEFGQAKNSVDDEVTLVREQRLGVAVSHTPRTDEESNGAVCAMELIFSRLHGWVYAQVTRGEEEPWC